MTKITHIDSTYLPLFRNGRIIGWLTPEESEKVWFKQQMIKLYGKQWYDEED